MSDLILYNGDIRTQEKKLPQVEAVAITEGKVRALGTNADIKKHKKSTTETVDLDGRLVLPGFTDCHVHCLSWSTAANTLQLDCANSLEQAIRQIKSAAGKLPSGTWINSIGLDEIKWPEKRLPEKGDLDAAVPSHPVLLRRKDGHMAVTNSLALKLSGICNNTPDPPGGIIERDRSGRLTGHLRENAIGLVSKNIPDPTEAEMIEMLCKSIPTLHSYGITAIHDFCIPGEEGNPFKAWQEIEKQGNLKIRCWFSLPGEKLEEAMELGIKTGFGSDRLKVGHLKYYVDGSIGSQTAWMTNPYEDGTCGTCVCSLPELTENVLMADRAGLSVAIHAIGDRANKELVSLFETVSRKHVDRHGTIAHRIEHAQILQPKEIERLSRLNIIASVQPLHLTDEISIHEGRIGERAKWAFPFRDMIDHGVNLIFGSDCPVSEPNPLWSIHAAITRCRRDGIPNGGWYPNQRVTLKEAIWAYTKGPALSCGVENKMGSICRGKLADMVVVNRNIYEIDPAEIAQTKVDMTIFNGEITYRR